VIPKFVEFFAGFGGTLPLVTRVVIGIASFLRSNILLIGIGLIAGVWFFRRWKRTVGGKRVLDGWMLRLPVIGPILHRFALSQFTRSLATLVGAGTPLVPALDISSGSIANQRVADAVTSVVPKVREGAELWRSLEETDQFTSLTVEMIKVGEATGALEEMLTNVSDFYDEQIEAALQRLINLIEPVILIVMGGVVATILLSIYLPMFTILSNIRS
jgi:type IV pilus assembly protein PilC